MVFVVLALGGSRKDSERRGWVRIRPRRAKIAGCGSLELSYLRPFTSCSVGRSIWEPSGARLCS